MEIKTPDLGVDSAEVSEIMVAVGDVINEGDNIVLLESDKASVEVPSTISGKIHSIMVSEGDIVSEGVVLMDIEAGATGEQQPESAIATADNGQLNSEHDDSDIHNPVIDRVQEPVEVAQPASSVASRSVTYGLPDLGVDNAQVAEIMVQVGDCVDVEQSLILVESDKASVEVPAPVAGKIVQLLISAGDTVTNGQDFIVIESNESSRQDNSADASHASPAPATPASVASASQQSTSSHDAQSDNAQANNQTQLTESEVNAKFDASQVYAGPAVRKLARQLGVDITQVTGTAVNNRIIKEDLFAFVKGRMQNAPNQQAPQPVSLATGAVASLPPLPDMSKTELWGEIEREPLTRLQKVSIPQLNYNTLIPQVTQFDLADITDTEAFRGTLKGQYKAEGIGLTILAFIIKAVAYALTQHPKFNSHLSDDNSELLIRKSVNMGIAVATPEGLVVPVLKNAQDKGIKQIAIEVGELAKKARDKKLTPKDITGASFTISSQGNLGGTAFTPLVTWPQVAILGVSESGMQPRWNAIKGEFEPRLMLPLSLSYDHRVINGADAAVFTRYVANLLADPRKILM